MYYGLFKCKPSGKKWNISQRRVQVLYSENRIGGAFKVGEVWAIPDDKRRKNEVYNNAFVECD